MNKRTSSPLISILTPVFNSGDTIDDAIKSVLGQTYPNWELLIIDDGSTDSSLSIVSKYAQNYSAIKVLANHRNVGPGLARNIGLNNAQGSYIAFLDADDIWHPQKLERQLQIMLSDPFAESCHTGYVRFSTHSAGHIKAKKILPRLSVTFDDLCRHNFICNSTALVRSSAVNDIRFNNIKHEDYDFWLKVLRNGKSVGIYEPLCGYRVHSSQTTHNKVLSVIWHFQVVSLHVRNRLELLQSMLSYVGYHVIRIWHAKNVSKFEMQWLNDSLAKRESRES